MIEAKNQQILRTGSFRSDQIISGERMRKINSMDDFDLAGKRVLLREDLNVPIKDGVISNENRINASLPTIQTALKARARVVIMSHLGRPEEGKFDVQFSLAPVARRLSELLGQEVRLVDDWKSVPLEVAPGRAVLCENVRFCLGEKKDSEDLGRAMAALCDIYVMDAFATAHRAQASTHAVARFAPKSCAGPLLLKELEALDKALEKPARPLLAIVGGAKVSSKLTILDALTSKVDELIVGGGIANNFLAASGHNVGKSLYEPDLLEEAKKIMGRVHVPIPVDVVCAREVSDSVKAVVKSATDVDAEDMILDVGPATASQYADTLKKAGTIIWNGPLGVFEYEQFTHGTRAMAEAIAQSKAFSLAGGGETVAALDKFGLRDKMSYVSTAGGAFLEYLEGRVLPAVAMLEERYSAVF